VAVEEGWQRRAPFAHLSKEAVEAIQRDVRPLIETTLREFAP
jgi:hypothetical protein